MAAHQVAIAKASFAAGLLRPDPESIPRDEITRFHDHLDQVISKCTASNVQKCKAWVIQHVVPSSARITALGKYLVALAASQEQIAPSSALKANSPLPEKAVALHRKRLHLLYLLSDIQHHTKHHGKDLARHTSLTSSLQPHLVALFKSAAEFDRRRRPKHLKRILSLLDLWEQQGYQAQSFIGKLRQTVQDGDGTAKGTEISSDKAPRDAPESVKEVPFIMPATHGDISTPYYDLPAGNLMPHIVPNLSDPINPDLVKPLKFVAGPADETLANAVRDFLKNVNSTYEIGRDNFEDRAVVVDIDEMGQPLATDETTGELVPRESYYGWSIEFCQKMRKRKQDGLPAAGTSGSGRRHSLNGSDSRSRSASRSPQKRQRFSRSHSRSRFGRNGLGRDDSRSTSRSRRGGLGMSSQYDRHSRSHPHARSPHRSYSRSRSRSPSRRRNDNETGRPRRRPRIGSSSSGSYSPEPASNNQSSSTKFSNPANLSSHHSQPSLSIPQQHGGQAYQHPPAPLPFPPHLARQMSNPTASNTPSGQIITPVAQITDPFSNGPLPPPPRPDVRNYNHHFPLNAQGLPIPPPPPFHTGNWPPRVGYAGVMPSPMVPPPPPGHQPQNQYDFGAVLPPPPPPPQPPSQGHAYPGHQEGAAWRGNSWQASANGQPQYQGFQQGQHSGHRGRGGGRW